jgi:beta-galactosidase
LEEVETDLAPLYRTVDGAGVGYRQGQTTYVNAWICDDLMEHLLQDICRRIGLVTQTMRADLRLTRRGNMIFAVNYGPEATTYRPDDARCILGGETLAPTEIAIWESTLPSTRDAAEF